MAGFAVGTLSSCYYEAPFPDNSPKKDEVVKYYQCGYMFYTMDGKKQTKVKLDNLTFKTGQKIFTYSSCDTKIEKKGATNNPESVVLYITKDGNGKIKRESPGSNNVRDSNKKSIIYNEAGVYRQKHYVLTSEGDEFAVKYFTVTIVDDK